VLDIMWETRLARAWTGQCRSKVASLWITAPFVMPFFEAVISARVAASDYYGN
jgi:hypothetical protein